MAASHLVMECAWGFPHVGEKTFLGPKKLVYVLAFGRIPSLVPTYGELMLGTVSVTSVDDVETA